MWNIFGAKKIPYEKIADLIRRCSIAASGECCEAMERFFYLKPQFDFLMYETIAFLMSTSLSELMLKQNGSTKEDYENLQHELKKAIGQCGVQSPDFFLYALMPTDGSFRQLTLSYYQGHLENLGISETELRSYSERFNFSVPEEGSFAMSVQALNIRVIKLMAVSGIENPSVETMASMKLVEILARHLKVFIDQVKRIV